MQHVSWRGVTAAIGLAWGVVGFGAGAAHALPLLSALLAAEGAVDHPNRPRRPSPGRISILRKRAARGGGSALSGWFAGQGTELAKRSSRSFQPTRSADAGSAIS